MSFDETRLSSRDLRVISAPDNREGIAEISGREGRALRTFVANSDLTDRSVEKYVVFGQDVSGILCHYVFLKPQGQNYHQKKV